MAWRLFFILSALLILIGGPQHPNGTMAEMLAHPAWVRSHALMLAGFVVLFVGLILLLRSRSLPERTRRWTGYAAVGAALQAIELVFHTAAVVDHANLMAGRQTPVLTTHLWLTAFLYPVFAFTFVGFVLAATADRVLGSRWIAWLGIVGAVAHGAAAILVVALGIEEAEFLFPLLTLCAIWLLAVGLWPLSARLAQPRREPRL